MVEQNEEIRKYPAAMVNITNRCTLRCAHCFIYREGNPNDPAREMDASTMLAKLARIQKERGVFTMLWMGGEPLLRPDVLREGAKLFARNHVTTNGSIDLIELPRTIYIISIDGPPDLNDSIRGKGAWEKVMKTLSRVPEDFGPTVMSQCVVTKSNEDRLEELVKLLMPTRVEGMTFSFYVPYRNDRSPLTWGYLERRDKAVREVMRLKEKYPHFIWNSGRALELTLSQHAKSVTSRCPSRRLVMPLWLDGDDFTHPFCCYGDDVDCDLCGAWVVFNLAAKMEKNGHFVAGGGE